MTLPLVLLAALALAAPLDDTAADGTAAEGTAAEGTAADNAVPGVPAELGRQRGLLALGAGIAFTVTSMTAFTAGFEAERQLRAGEARGSAADAALTQRAVAALVAWPAAVLAVTGVLGGTWLLAVDGEP